MSPGRWLALGALALGVLLLALALGAYAYVQTPYGEQEKRLLVDIPEGSSARQVGHLLEREGVVGRGWVFARLLRFTGVHRELKAGEYEIRLPISPVDVMQLLHDGRVATIPITLPEGLTLAETARLLGEAGIAAESDLLAAFGSAEPIRDLDQDASDLEGYLFPETYRFARETDPSTVAEQLVREFRRRFTKPFAAEIERHELNVRELVTLASLVEKETGQRPERGKIAGVFTERLDRGMPMQCDPTIIYGKKLVGSWDGNITRADLTWNHPYNTYVHPGLPPGPIASPGLDSLLAAIRPERTGELYFVASGDGGHVFSRTLAEHNRNVRRYQLGGRSGTRGR